MYSLWEEPESVGKTALSRLSPFATPTKAIIYSEDFAFATATYPSLSRSRVCICCCCGKDLYRIKLIPEREWQMWYEYCTRCQEKKDKVYYIEVRPPDDYYKMHAYPQEFDIVSFLLNTEPTHD